ncbi:MAG: sialate O-acetylesterase [Spirochaetaceae bacterium]|jgi:sialate O-acetylesterase|nr:sialate O-acetylesterase [Spirochaetaceae bacterium]
MNDALTVPAVFQNNMILQRQKPIRIWGTGPGRSVVGGVLNGAEASAPVGDDGAWELRFPPMEASSGGRLALFCDGKPVCSFEEVAIGEVWIAGGQSNMEFALCYECRRREVFRRSPDPLLRYFEVPKRSWEGQREGDPFTGGNFAAQGIWLQFSPENAPLFSATAYYFAARLREKLGPGVPVGIISCNWSGSPAFAWIGEEDLRADWELGRFWTEYEGRIKTQDREAYEEAYAKSQAEGRSPLMRLAFDCYMRGRIPIWMGDALKKVNPGFFDLQLAGPRDPWRPCGLYATMVSAIAGYPCRGVIWYQGEGDDARPEYYARLFALVIRCWRRAWGDELPFIFAQLAAFERDHFQRGDSFPELRRQQELAATTVPRTWMVCTMDLGERYNIHPGNKGPVGERLAAAALAKVYGFDVPWRSPRVRGVNRGNDGSLRIRFDGGDGGLFIRGNRLRGLRLRLKLFARGGELRQSAEIRRFAVHTEGDTLVVMPGEPGGPPIEEIRYAAEPYAELNLFNGAGFPALPFCLTTGPDSRWRRDNEVLEENHGTVD